MKAPELSVIMAVYNVSSYLQQSLDSIIGQTLSDFEILCVNDGSTDRSPKILEEYSQKNPRVKVIHKENGGLSSAWNTGLKHASGKYVCFVDPDDWIEPKAFELLHDNAAKHDSDIVLFQAHLFDDHKKIFLEDSGYFTMRCFDDTFDNIVFDHTMTSDFLFKINVTVWSKFYKRKFLQTHHFSFPEGLCFEDNVFFYNTYLKATRISLIKEKLYTYRLNRAGSIINTNNKKFFDLIQVNHLVEKIIRQTNNKKYIDDFTNIRIKRVITRLKQVEVPIRDEFLDLIKQDFLQMPFEDINRLKKSARTMYENILLSNSFCEYETREKILQYG